MKYFDLHCDALTNEGVSCVTKDSLETGECALQCFAAFLRPNTPLFEEFCRLRQKFVRTCEEYGYHPVKCGKDLKEGKINALFTVEEGGVLEGKLSRLNEIYAYGVRMIGLTWNYQNEVGYPCFPDYGELKYGNRLITEREGERGLTEFGKEVVLKMNELGMIIDVSHGSDRLVSDVLFYSRHPIVASHSNAQRVFDCARNLSDYHIREIARNGGVVGINFCADFLSKDKSREGQREAIFAHLAAIYNAGGEDCLAIGSDFDGAPQNAYLPSPAAIQPFLQEVSKQYGSSVCEKLAYKNFLRVFSTVCG